LLEDSGGCVEKKRQLYAVRVRRSHRPVVALSVELSDLVLFCKRSPNSEAAIEGGLVAAVTSLSAVH